MPLESLQGRYIRKAQVHWVWWIETQEGAEVLSGTENNAYDMQKVIKLHDHVEWELIK